MASLKIGLLGPFRLPTLYKLSRYDRYVVSEYLDYLQLYWATV
jgi:hypothetical protein